MLAGQAEQLLERGRRHPSPRHVLCDAVPDVGRPAVDVVQVEATDDRPLLVHEHVVGASARVLLGEEPVVLRLVAREERIATIGDRGGEVGAVLDLEREDRGGVIRTESLQIRHRPNVSVEATDSSR